MNSIWEAQYLGGISSNEGRVVVALEIDMPVVVELDSLLLCEILDVVLDEDATDDKLNKLVSE
jgi:hypothetical protein